MKIYSQPKKSLTCGPYCVRMVLEGSGRKVSIGRILKQIPVYKKWGGSFLGDNALCLLENGVNVKKVVTFGMQYYAPEDLGLGQKKLLEAFGKRLKGKLKGNVRKRLASLVKFMKAGGKVEIRIPAKREIISSVKKGNPVMVIIDRKVLYGKGTGAVGHYVLISRYKDGKFRLHDPHWLVKGKKKWYDTDTIMYAMYARGGDAILIA